MASFLGGAVEMVSAVANRARNMSALWGSKRKTDAEMKKLEYEAEMLLRVSSQPGWQILMQELRARRDTHIQAMLHDRDKSRDALCERAAELDSVLKWIDDAVEAGVRVGRKGESDGAGEG